MKRLLFSWLFFVMQISSFAQAGFQFEEDKSKVIIPFHLINNLIFIPIMVNGVELNFLLDSGVEETILLSLDDKEQVSFNNVKKINLRGLGSDESIEGLKSSNNILSFDGLVDRHHDLYIVLDQSFNFSSHVGIPVNGIIGYHFFKDNLVEVNYNRKKIIVYKDTPTIQNKLKKKYSSIPISIEKSKPYAVASVTIFEDVLRAKLLLDLGNSDAVWLFENMEKQIQIPTKNFEDYLGKGFSGEINGRRSKIEKVALSDFEFHHPIIAFPDSTSLKSVNMVKDRVGSIGGEILKRFTLVFDYQNQKLFLKKGRFYDDPFTYNKSGIELENEGMQWVPETVPLQTEPIVRDAINVTDKSQNNFKYKFVLKPIYSIANVRKNSPAARCGLLKGDVIVSINNVTGYKYSLQEINELLKSDYDKWLTIEVERTGQILKFRFQLQNTL